MSKEETKNFSQLDGILKLADKYEEIEQHTLANGELIEYYPYFSAIKINEITEEFYNYSNSEDKTDKKFMDTVLENDFNLVMFYYFLAVKKFTHYGEQMKRIKKVKSLVPYYNALLETGILQEIVDDVFLFEELMKLNEMIGKHLGRTNAALEIMTAQSEELEKRRQDFQKTLNSKK